MISRHMQMRVHGLALVGILLTQAHVLNRVHVRVNASK